MSYVLERLRGYAKAFEDGSICQKDMTEAADRIEELERENAALKEQWKEVEGRLMNDIAELRADAERYRWLRNPTHADVFVCPTDTCEALDLEELDAAIDAASRQLS